MMPPLPDEPPASDEPVALIETSKSAIAPRARRSTRPPDAPETFIELLEVLLLVPRFIDPPGTAITIEPPAVVPATEAALREALFGKLYDVGEAIKILPAGSPETLMLPVLVEPK